MEDRLDRSLRGGAMPVAVLAGILVVTAGWWALALWPLSSSTPEWLIRTRAACFGTGASGLPDAGGWMLLVGEPIGMIGVLVIVWGEQVASGFRALAGSAAGRLLLAGAGVALFAGAGAAATTVRRAISVPPPVDGTGPPLAWSRIDREPPPLRLVSQSGDTVDLARLRGRPVIVAFAYGHCETACPLTVHEVLEARRLAGDSVVVLLTTLDPWRDTPARLPALAARWALPRDAHVLSGSVPAVQSVLDAWGVAGARDERTGDIAHATTVFLLSPSGRIAFAPAQASGAELAALVGKLVRESPE